MGITITLFQDSVKKIKVVPARQLNDTFNEQNQKAFELQNSSYIPLKVNPGGIMPLISSSIITLSCKYPIQILVDNLNSLTSYQKSTFTNFSLIILNTIFVIMFSFLYSFLI